MLGLYLGFKLVLENIHRATGNDNENKITYCAA